MVTSTVFFSVFSPNDSCENTDPQEQWILLGEFHGNQIDHTHTHTHTHTGTGTAKDFRHSLFFFASRNRAVHESVTSKRVSKVSKGIILDALAVCCLGPWPFALTGSFVRRLSDHTAIMAASGFHPKKIR